MNHDGVIDIHYCGICPSDIHQVRDEWGGNSKFPIVFGHEIIGKVFKIGPKVTRFKKYDSVGMGCMVDSCRYCDEFAKGLEQYCTGGGPPHLLSRTGYSRHQDTDTGWVFKQDDSQ